MLIHSRRIIYIIFAHIFLFLALNTLPSFTPPPRLQDFVKGGAILYRGRREEIPQKTKHVAKHPVTVTMVIRTARARGLPLPVTDTPQDKQWRRPVLRHVVRALRPSYCTLLYVIYIKDNGGGRGIDSPHRTCPRLINNIMSGGYGIMCLSSWFSIRLDRTPTPKSRVLSLSLSLSVPFSHTHIHRYTYSLSLFLSFDPLRCMLLQPLCVRTLISTRPRAKFENGVVFHVLTTFFVILYSACFCENLNWLSLKHLKRARL